MFPSALSITRRTKRKTVLIYCMPSSMAELTGGIADLKVVLVTPKPGDAPQIAGGSETSPRVLKIWGRLVICPLICMTRSLPRRSLKAKAGGEERQLATR